MKLELKHLAPYLPYELNFWAGKIAGCDLTYPMLGIPIMGKIISYTNGEDDTDGCNQMNLKQMRLKPVLRPLSDLTKEIEVNGEKFVPVNKIFQDVQDLQICEYSSNGKDKTITATYKLMGDIFTDFVINRNDIKYTDYHIVQKLFEWHFDVFDLIKNNLAIDINTLDK